MKGCRPAIETTSRLPWPHGLVRLKAEPSSPIPHFLAGAEYAQAGWIAEAEASYATAVQLSPGFDIARYQLGLLQFTSGRAAVAQVTWEPLFALREGHYLRCFVEGFAALAADRFEAALALYSAGMQANRANPPMNADIAKVIAGIKVLPAAIHITKDK